MVKNLQQAAFIVATLLTSVSWAQGGSIRSWVTDSDVVQDRPFWLFVEASGERIGPPQITQAEGLVINSNSPQRSRSLTGGGGRPQLQTIKLSYSTTALKPGAVVIPPVKALINGQTLETDPITLNVLPLPAGTPKPPIPVRAWTTETQVAVGGPFWIYIEATGSEIALPRVIEIEGIAIDPRNAHHSSSFSFGKAGMRTVEKRGFYAVATREGQITIPGIEIRVSGRTYKTNAIEITAKSGAIASVPAPRQTTAQVELTADDLVSIEMSVSKDEVYQGEPILLSQELWRIKYRRISSGPYRGGLIVNPTTEGFYVDTLEPQAFEATRGPWSYEVTETRKLLYPTRSGNLRVGKWHWEGIALINRQSIIARDKRYYKLNAGPIDIKVKPLPRAPEGFTGAVGTFDVSASLDTQSVIQGVPIKFLVTIRGWGNPDAVGGPILPELEWASVKSPNATHRFFKRPSDDSLQMAKYFTYEVTPLTAGPATIPEFDFIYFDLDKEEYTRKSVGPFEIKVLPTGESAQHLVLPPDAGLIERQVDILADDIQPLLPRRESIEVHRPSPIALPIVVAGPVISYLLLSLVMTRRRRFATNRGFARAHHAKTMGLKRLRGVQEADEPADALYRAMIGFVADIYDLEESGLTSADIKGELEGRSIEPGLSERTIRILKACERSRYASQPLSDDEVSALLNGAEVCMLELRALKRKGKRP